MAHSKISPSSAERWMQCPGSVELLESLGIKSSPPTVFSSEGTFAHAIRAEALTTGRDVASFVGTKRTVDGFVHECTSEMAEHLRFGIERLRSEGGKMLVEERVDLDQWIPEAWGTADAVVIVDDLLIVDDLKYGAGVGVGAERNPQLMAYALGLLRHAPKAGRVLLRIDQPRTPGFGSSWEITTAELRAWGASVLRPAALEALSKGAPLAPSDEACRWCAAKAQCPALAAHALEVAGFSDLTVPPVLPLALTPAQRSVVLRHREQIEGWLSALAGAAMADAEAGLPVPGFKLVAGRRGNRAWLEGSEPTVVSILKERAYENKLVSPATAEKLLGKGGKEAIAPLVVQAEGKPLLVPDDDKRPALTVGAVFDVIESNTSNPWE